MLITKAPKGVGEVLPQDSYRWHAIEDTMRETCRRFGFREVRVPTFEHTELFLRGVGGTTDIVQKEMYTFEDKGGRSITLKPEGTAGVARTYVEKGLANLPMPVKMYYLYSPVFRYEQPQAGRLREHHQFGVEVFGSDKPSMDAEVIMLALQVIENVGIHGLEVHLNSIGCPNCRPAYMDKLRTYFAQHMSTLCPTCQGRMERNPLRIFDCKSDICQGVVAGAPNVEDSLCDDCKEHFTTLQGYLQNADVTFKVNPRLVRGLDYYTRTVFEIIAPQIGAQSTVCGGGRYDKLIEEIGGSATPGIGFGMGMERLLLAMEKYGDTPMEEPPLLDVYLAPMGDAAKAKAFSLVQTLRATGLATDTDHIGRSMKAQFKFADKSHCRFVGVLGDNELAEGVIRIKDMHTSEESNIPLVDIKSYLLGKMEE